jgi:competence protein CoiA
MMYADTASGRAEASPGLEGTCPSCGHPCRPKCGNINVWHWAHHAGADCDPWSEPMTEWHLGWQRAVPPERREVVKGPHRADIVTASGGVVEIQHSPVSDDVIAEREEFYGYQMAWIFDATKVDITVEPAPAVLANTPCGCANKQCARIWLRPGTVCRCQHEGCAGRMAKRQWKLSPEVRFRWKYARRSVAACRRPVFLDLGQDRVLRLPELFAPADEMTGMLYTRASVEGWLHSGALLERFPLPSAPPPYSRYDPPYMEQYRTPDAWWEIQEQQRRRIFGADVPQPGEQPEPPAADAQVATTDEEWFAAMFKLVPAAGPEACRTLWREAVEKYRSSELAEVGSVKVFDLIQARIEALANVPQDAAEPAEVTLSVPAPVTAGLDPRSGPARRLPVWRRIWQAYRGWHGAPARRSR